MRVLLLTGSHPIYHSLLQLSDEQITAGPEWPDAQMVDGRWLSMRTESGETDLEQLLSRIPAAQTPDAVVCVADAGWSVRPVNLRAFKGTKVLLLADRPGDKPEMSEVFRYVGGEVFDRVMFMRDQAQLARLLGGAAPGIAANLVETVWPSENPTAHARVI
ncbi:MAG: hypothetical protein QG602_514 [Verrucomicrobiota bacterium]|nr:hypothetical protein [Verrucomicrobiota bacterium]